MDASPDEFVGLTRERAQQRAEQMGWTVRDVTEPGWYTSELRTNRIDIWLDDKDIVARAALS